MERPPIGSSVPNGVRIRPYEPRDKEAILAIEKKRHEEWGWGSVSDPDDPHWVAIVVAVDENDKPIMAMGARRVAELGSTIDKDRGLSLYAIRDLLGGMWAKLAVRLYRDLAFDEAFCRVSSPTPGWANMIEKRAGFERSAAPHFYLDLEKTLGRFKR